MGELVRVSAPSRVHFGLLRLSCAEGPSFGGLGLMVDQPRTVVELKMADVWESTGPLSDRALEFAQQAWRFFGGAADLAIQVRVCDVPAAHAGLGTGTQLALAVAQAVATLLGQADYEMATLAAAVGRGNRSAVGTHGFAHGGLIWETGRENKNSLGQLGRRVSLPEDWRIVLIAPSGQAGLHGKPEAEAFSNLPPADARIATQLLHLVEYEILPAAEQKDLSGFAEAVYQYGQLSGSYFSSVQGGVYASAPIARVVATVREFGAQGVGQSSWGPTVFAILPNEAAANGLIARLSPLQQTISMTYTIAAPDNQGARISK